jgi:hypothetical protein
MHEHLAASAAAAKQLLQVPSSRESRVLDFRTFVMRVARPSSRTMRVPATVSLLLLFLFSQTKAVTAAQSLRNVASSTVPSNGASADPSSLPPPALNFKLNPVAHAVPRRLVVARNDTTAVLPDGQCPVVGCAAGGVATGYGTCVRLFRLLFIIQACILPVSFSVASVAAASVTSGPAFEHVLVQIC